LSTTRSNQQQSHGNEVSISVTVVEARGLVANDQPPIDVYCRVCVGGAVECTPTLRRVRAPVWNATVEFDLVGAGDELVLELFAADRFAYDEPIGLAIVRLGDQIHLAAGCADRWVPFIDAPMSNSAHAATSSSTAGGAGGGGEVHVIVKTIREELLDASVTLAVAVRDGSVRAVTRLLRDAAVDVNAQDAFGYAPLHTAVTMGDGVLRPLLSCARINVNLRNRDGNTPFHYFCAKWRTPNCALLFDMFVAKGAQINAQNINGESPLHKAVMNGFVRLILVRMLLAQRADPNQLTNKGEAPLHYAVHLKREDVVLSLVQGGADVSLRGKGGKTPYGLAVDLGETRIARLLGDVKALFDWLGELGLDEYRSAFIEHEIFLPVLPALDDDTLDVLGVTALGHRITLLNEFKREFEILVPVDRTGSVDASFYARLDAGAHRVTLSIHKTDACDDDHLVIAPAYVECTRVEDADADLSLGQSVLSSDTSSTSSSSSSSSSSKK
jgi:ankyrin repeat protein